MYETNPIGYCLYTLQTKADNSYYWLLTRRFSDKHSLISFLADSVVTNNYDDSSRWHSDYFDKINVTENDTYHWDTVSLTNTVYGLRYYKVNHHHSLRPYLFTLEDGATIVDVRNFKEEVFALVYARLNGMFPEKGYGWDNSWKHRRTKSHTCIYYHNNSHFHRTLRNSYVEEYEDEAGNIVKFTPKPKELVAKYKWRDDYWSKGECGWKTHKNKHQWEHNLKNKEKRALKNERA